MNAPERRADARISRLVLAMSFVVGLGCASGSSSDATGSAGTTGTSTGAAGSGTTGAAGGTGAAGSGSGTGAGGTGASVVDAGTDSLPITSDGGAGAGGVTGAAGTGVGAAGATGAAGSGMPGCQVQLYRVLPTLLGAATTGAEMPLSQVTGLESGSILRVKARAEGFSGDLDWDWTITLEGAAPGSDEVVVTPLDDTISVLDISLAKPGVYNITARIRGATQCRAAFHHPTVREPSASAFLFRVTPPAGSRLPTREIRVLSADASRAMRTLDLGTGGAGQVLSIAPIDGHGAPLPSFVRVSGPSFGFDLQGYTGTGPVVTTLDSMLSYEVLIVPETALAPVLVRGSGSPQFFDGRMTISPGSLVSGYTRDGTGRPIEGTRILLRADTGRPSTIGVSGATGAFALRTGDGVLSVTIVPPPGSGLPEARVPVAPGIVLASGVMDLELSMTWAASITSASLEVVVRDHGVAVEGARVRADIVGELSAGQVRVLAGGVVGATYMYFPATGTARAEEVTDAQGVARLGLLPTGKYRVTVAPPVGSAAAVTSTTVDLPLVGASVPLALSERVKVTGTLLPASDGAGVRLIALDTGVLAPTSPAMATADASGKYELMLSPGRTYELLAEPPGGKRWQRIAVARTLVPPGGAAWIHALPPGLSVSGIVTGAGRPVAGAIVQVFCVTPPASCVDATIPLSEGVTRADGTLALTLPDFAL